MFLHLGKNTVVFKKEVIAILDAKVISSQITQEFLNNISRDKQVIDISGSNQEKSYVITDDKIFISPISCNALRRRTSSYFN